MNNTVRSLQSKHVELKAKRLVDEHCVFESFRTREYSRFVVEGDKGVYQVHLWNDGTIECTCPYWTYKRQLCSHIMACYLYHNPRHRVVGDPSEWELSPEELEQLAAEADDLFAPRVKGASR